MQGNIVPHCPVLDGSRIDDQADPVLPVRLSAYRRQELCRVKILHRQTGFPDGRRGPFRRIQLHPQIPEAPRQRQNVGIIRGFDAQQDTAPRFGDTEARCGQAFEHGLGQTAPQPQHLAGRLHFRSQDGVGIRELFEGKDRHLDRIIGRRMPQTRAAAQVPQLLSQHDAGRDVHHADVCHL